MAETRKRTTSSKAPASSASSPATPAPAASNNGLYLIVASIAGLAAFVGYSFSSSSSSTTNSILSPSAISSAVSSVTSSIAPSAPSDRPLTPDGKIQLTDAELLAYTGEDASKPIYVALNGTIFDVSSGRGFYGPGGHYGHFAGRDATRAWVSECFDAQYLTWDMKGVEKMFLPKWMDEEMEEAATGQSKEKVVNALSSQASALVEKFGKVSKKEKVKRREEDAEDVKKGIEQAMGHWLSFFKKNPKYKEVGVVVGREELPEDREDIGLCEEALKKRPVRGGKFQALMDKNQALADMAKKEGDDTAKKGKKPDFVKG